MTNIYSQVKTFDELCGIGCDFIQNKIKLHPFLIVDNTKDNLYELVGQNEWIRDYLYQYNMMGFYTVMSQPGSDYHIQIYPTYLDYKNSFIPTLNIVNPLDSKFGVKQRAEVEGFMKLEKAVKLFNLLKNEPEIKIGLSTCYFNDDNGNSFNNYSNQNTINNYATLSYQIENNNQIRFMESEAETNEIIRLELEGSERNYKLSQLKHVVRRYFIVRNYPLKKHIQNLADTDIIGISIMDLIWDRNDYLWEKIYLCMKDIL
jgi:hypothetical protein